MEIKTIRPPRPGSAEALCHDMDQERFLWDFRKDRNDELHQNLAQPRLQRYIGVIYRPESERASHYSGASLSDQYDGFVCFDRTSAVTRLPTLATETEDETYPFGL